MIFGIVVVVGNVVMMWFFFFLCAMDCRNQGYFKEEKKIIKYNKKLLFSINFFLCISFILML